MDAEPIVSDKKEEAVPELKNSYGRKKVVLILFVCSILFLTALLLLSTGLFYYFKNSDVKGSIIKSLKTIDSLSKDDNYSNSKKYNYSSSSTDVNSNVNVDINSEFGTTKYQYNSDTSSCGTYEVDNQYFKFKICLLQDEATSLNTDIYHYVNLKASVANASKNVELYCKWYKDTDNDYYRKACDNAKSQVDRYNKDLKELELKINEVISRGEDLKGE